MKRQLSNLFPAASLRVHLLSGIRIDRIIDECESLLWGRISTLTEERVTIIHFDKTLRCWRNSQHPWTRPFNFAVVAFTCACVYCFEACCEDGTKSGSGEHNTRSYMSLISWICTSKVTGANQGIGLEIVRQLCKKFEGKVILSGKVVEIRCSEPYTYIRRTWICMVCNLLMVVLLYNHK